MQLDPNNSPLIINNELGINFQADFNFTFAVYLKEYEMIALFSDNWSGEINQVGKLYTRDGKLIQSIPFPPNGVGGRQNAFGGATEYKNGVKIYFHQEMERDFWGVFSINENKYIDYHESR